MIPELFLTCALALPTWSHTQGPDPLWKTSGYTHSINKDDALFFGALTKTYREANQKDPHVMFAYDHVQFAELLRVYGVRAYSLSKSLSGGHVKGLLGDMPFGDQSLAALVIMQGISYLDLFDMIDAVGLAGVLLIEDSSLPYMGGYVLQKMGFHRTYLTWHSHQLWKRREIKSIKQGEDFDLLNSRNLSPHIVHMIGASA